MLVRQGAWTAASACQEHSKRPGSECCNARRAAAGYGGSEQSSGWSPLSRRVGKRHAAPRYDRRVSHPDPSAPADLAAIEPGEVWENPVTGERAVVLELPWENPEARGVAELTAFPGARVMGSTCTRRCLSASASSRGS